MVYATLKKNTVREIYSIEKQFVSCFKFHMLLHDSPFTSDMKAEVELCALWCTNLNVNV